MSQHLTSQQATAEIIALIHSSPHSPRPDEIDAIIAKMAPQQPPLQRSAEAEKYIQLHKWWCDPSIDEWDEAELGRRHGEVSKEWLRIVQAGTDVEALAAVTLSILEDVEVDFDNPHPVASEPEPGRWGEWAGHALARAVLRQRAAGPLGEVSPAVAAAFAEWEAARAQDHAAGNAYGRSDDEADSIRAEHCGAVHSTKSEALLALGAHSLADLALLLPVVIEWNLPMCVTSSDFPDCILEKGGEDEGEDLERRSVAYFIRAVMDLLRKQGVQFEPGRRPKIVRDI